MDPMTETKYFLANTSEHSLPGLSDYDDSRPKRPQLFRSTATICLACGFLLSLAYNVVLSLKLIPWPLVPDMCRSHYTGLGMNTPIIYESHWGQNQTLSDEYWEDLDTSPIVVALSHNYADQHGLARSVPFPWDDEKGLYHIKAFHQLHCLKVIRKAFRSPSQFAQFSTSEEHVYHCLNMLRQDLMCKADDTPMPSVDAPHAIGNNQVMQCRDWDQLVAWSRHPERNACFELLSDYKPVAHRLEQYAFCPKSSPHYEVMKAYFERHGHKAIFED